MIVNSGTEGYCAAGHTDIIQIINNDTNSDNNKSSFHLEVQNILEKY